MHKSNKVVYFAALVVAMQGLFSACSHTPRSIITCKKQVESRTDTSSDYAIELPFGWHEIAEFEDVKRQAFWGFSSSSYKVGQGPLYRAWNAPESDNAFLAIMHEKLPSNLSISSYYKEAIQWIRNAGWTIQDSGNVKIDEQYCKWWIQSHAKSSLHQLCYLIGNGPNVYVLAFTTTSFSQDKQKLFNKIAQTITF